MLPWTHSLFNIQPITVPMKKLNTTCCIITALFNSSHLLLPAARR